ncbi:SLAF5 protein, partial [Pterocles burchelli]|nr:SLAF5 protein [Pterocles burchelli]
VCDNDGEEVTRALGRSVTFRLQSPDGEATAWSFHNDIIVTVKFGNPPEPTFFDSSYKPRLTFTENGRALTISQLQMDDAGTYTAKTAKEKKTIFTLRVYRELVVPTVTCAAQNCSADGCRYTLGCTAVGSGFGDVSYSWNKEGWLVDEGPTVLVEEPPPGEEPSLLTCTAQNPVSSRNITILSPITLCAGNRRGKMR